MHNSNRQWWRVAVVAVVMALAGCATDEYGQRLPVSDTAKGGMIGAGAGAALGALIGSGSANAGKGALIGAVGGGITGALVGQYMDNQKKDLQRVLRPELDSGVITLQPLSDNRLLVSMTGETAFDVDSPRIKPGFYSTLDKIADVVNRYGKTQLIIIGHTDSTGTAQHNQVLSEERAASVQDYLLGRGVIPQRLSAEGVGPRYPRATNDTPEGRALNRRVELVVVPIVVQG